jgi:hypothetical protein
MRWFVSALLVALIGLTHVASASAQNTSVAVLGLTSLEGDDSYAGNLSAALRRAASQVRGWSVTDRDVPLSRMELANGCDASDLACLGQIATTMGVQRIIYGTMQHGTGTPMMYLIHIALYDAATNTILHQMDVELSSARSDIDDMREPARRYATELAGVQEAVAVTPPPTDVAPEVLPPPAEEHHQEPVQQGQGTDIGRLNWPAFALLLVAAGGAAGWVVSGLQAQEQATLLSNDRAMRTGSGNQCEGSNFESASLDVQTACGSNADIMQFVFIGLTAVAGGTGVILLAANGFESPASTSEHANLRILPSITQTSASMQLSLDF